MEPILLEDHDLVGCSAGRMFEIDYSDRPDTDFRIQFDQVRVLEYPIHPFR